MNSRGYFADGIRGSAQRRDHRTFYPLYPLLEKSVRSVAASPPYGVKVGFAANSRSSG